MWGCSGGSAGRQAEGRQKVKVAREEVKGVNGGVMGGQATFGEKTRLMRD